MSPEIKAKIDEVLSTESRSNYDDVYAMQESIAEEFSDEEMEEHGQDIQDSVEAWWEANDEQVT